MTQILSSPSLRPMRLFALLLALAAAVFSSTASAAETPTPVLLISMDGFRWDYTERYPEQTSHIQQLAREGVAAKGLIPVFPSNTFPNHYALVTGLYPSHSGIINNRMFDAQLNAAFVSSQPASSRNSRWWGGEPVWITAVLQGKKSACSFWPGSEAEIKGVHATHWKPYDYSIPFEKRLDELVGWMKQSAELRPCIATFYLEESNSAGHRFGPDSPELADTLRLLDGRLAAITSRFKAEGIPLNLVLVSDHGMTPCGPDQVVVLDDYINVAEVQVDFEETTCGLRPGPGADIEALMRQLSRMPHAKAYLAKDLPPHLHVDPANPRVPPIWILPDEGWQVQRRSIFAQMKDHFVRGQHGYDPALPSMHGILIANGPAFRSGVTVPEVENVHVYNLLCALAGLKPAPNDGDDRLVKGMLK